MKVLMNYVYAGLIIVGLVAVLLLFMLLATGRFTGTQPTEYVEGEIPSYFAELTALVEMEQAGQEVPLHPLLEDLSERVRRFYTTGNPQLVSFFQYGDRVFYEFKHPDTGHFHVFVYQWNGRQWKFEQRYCNTCPESGYGSQVDLR